jgi:hypothetical protein
MLPPGGIGVALSAAQTSGGKRVNRMTISGASVASAYGSFLTLSAHSGLSGNVSKGSWHEVAPLQPAARVRKRRPVTI